MDRSQADSELRMAIHRATHILRSDTHSEATELFQYCWFCLFHAYCVSKVSFEGLDALIDGAIVAAHLPPQVTLDLLSE